MPPAAVFIFGSLAGEPWVDGSPDKTNALGLF